MSTLGDLLAEHTVLPGNAVDHLHAVVGEWLLLADAVGSLADAEQMPLMTAAFQSGTIGRETGGGQKDSPGLKVEAVPVRYNNDVVAVLTHETALAARNASPLESAYLDCAGDLLLMLSEGTFPNVGDLAMSRSSPRVGD